MKFYRTDLGGSRHAGIQFQIVAIIGCAVGVYATEKPAEIEALSKLSPKVTEITQAEYEDYQKKKVPGFKNSNVLSVPLPHPRQTTISGEGHAVVVETKKEDRPVEIKATQIQTAEDALIVAPVEAAPAPEPEPLAPTTRRRGNR